MELFKKALILSGGSIKGAFEAGAIKAVFDSGFEPNLIYGISIGALNAAFIVNKIGESNNTISWRTVGQDLVDFWLNFATSPRAIMRKVPFYKLAYQILTGKFRSLLDMSPTHKLVRQTIKVENLRQSKVLLKVGAVNLFTGEIEYFDSNHPQIIDAIIASTAIPLVMPYVYINGMPYVDGGVRDVAPVRPLLFDHNVRNIIMVICHPEVLSKENFNPGKLIKYIERTKNITVNELVNEDLRLIDDINDKKLLKVKYKIIRPEKEIRLTIDKFTRQDIERLIDWGYQAAMKVMDKKELSKKT